MNGDVENIAILVGGEGSIKAKGGLMNESLCCSGIFYPKKCISTEVFLKLETRFI